MSRAFDLAAQKINVCSALGWLTDALTSAREKTLVSRLFKRSCLRCIEMKPDDALAHNLLGRYCYNVARLTWLERTVASSLMGCKLNDTYQDAEESFRRAHEHKNDWMPTGLWMARVLSARQRPLEEVQEWIEFGLRMECKEPTTEIERRELLELRSRLFDSTQL